MEVDQSKYMNFFTNNINNNNNNEFYNINHNFITPQMNNNDVFQPMYNLNDVVYHQLSSKQAVKDDSGITFNNSLIPPSRKRSREPVPCVPSQLLNVNPCLVQTGAKRSNTSSCVNFVEKNNINNINNNNSSDGGSFAFLGQDLSLQIMQQDLELDRFISNHMERMKVEIEERKKQQLTRIISAMGESLGRKLREKEEELTKIGRINYALEEKVKSLCLENQIWRDLAQTNEATANALRTNLEQLLQQINDNAAVPVPAAQDEDAVSCCGSTAGDVGADREDVGESMGNGWIYRGKKDDGRKCRKCGEGESSVLLLPCRHLCLCTACGPAVNVCPICYTVKNASVHVNLS
ncbi:hypothetical protein RND81_03G097400 [Saponaria officinalis]|uniref:RING-type domain-containing protein n=1 Tax=Saponaria officinalis TaxID=3572 RepID=A0AAW1M5Q6_SAPOF